MVCVVVFGDAKKIKEKIAMDLKSITEKPEFTRIK